MVNDRELEMLCAVIGNVGTDDRGMITAIRDPTPSLFSPSFPARFPTTALYTEWTGTGVWRLAFRIVEDRPEMRVVHEDCEQVLDLGQSSVVCLVLDLGEVEFTRPGKYTLNFHDLESGEWIAGRGLVVLPGDVAIMRGLPE